MAAIRHVLGELPGRLFKVLVTHHPLAVPMLAAPLQMVGRARRALDAVADAGVHLLLSGHYHRWAGGEAPAQVTRQRSVLVAHAGTAVSTRTRGGEANSYNLIRLDGRRLEVAVMGWQPQGGFIPAERQRFVLGASGWSAAPAVAMVRRKVRAILIQISAHRRRHGMVRRMPSLWPRTATGRRWCRRRGVS